MKNEKIMCPLVDAEIEDIDCIENADAVDDILQKYTVPEQFKRKKDWENICKECKWHGY